MNLLSLSVFHFAVTCSNILDHRVVLVSLNKAADVTLLSVTDTLNTDIKGYVSKDGGSNWVQATLVDKGSIGTYNLLTAIDEDVSDATSNQTDGGVAMKWKITTHNQASNMYQRIHSVALGWK